MDPNCATSTIFNYMTRYARVSQIPSFHSFIKSRSTTVLMSFKIKQLYDLPIFKNGLFSINLYLHTNFVCTCTFLMLKTFYKLFCYSTLLSVLPQHIQDYQPRNKSNLLNNIRSVQQDCIFVKYSTITNYIYL